MRASYAPGTGLLLGTGGRWLLADCPPAPGTVQQLWDDLVGPRRPDVEGVAALALSLGATSVAVVDLDTGGARAVRGVATLAERGGAVVIALADGHDQAAELPLDAGAVPASSVRVTVTAPAVSRPASPPPSGASSAVTGLASPGGGLIDGIPDAILSASAPEPRPRLRVPEPPAAPAAPSAPAPRPPAPQASASAPPAPSAPPHESDTAGRTGGTTGPHTSGPHTSGRHTGDSDHHTRLRGQLRAEVEPAAPPPPPAHATDRPSGPPAPPPVADSDHDGHTSMRGAPPPPPEHLSHPTGETVQAVRCRQGHFSPAHSPVCRTCGTPVPAQPPSRVPRPPLGVLRLPDGQALLLDRGVVLGRRPSALPGGDPWPHLVRLPDEATHLSRLHLQVELDGWLVLARDLGSRAGTTLRVPGRAPERIRAHEAVILEDGHLLDLADDYPVTFTTSLELNRRKGAR